MSRRISSAVGFRENWEVVSYVIPLPSSEISQQRFDMDPSRPFPPTLSRLVCALPFFCLNWCVAVFLVLNSCFKPSCLSLLTAWDLPFHSFVLLKKIFFYYSCDQRTAWGTWFSPTIWVLDLGRGGTESNGREP